MMNKSKFAVAGLVLATVALPATAFAGTMKVATSATFHVNAVGAGVSGGMGLKTAGHAKGVITVNAKTGRVCYNIEAVAIPGINAAHIHAGKRGVDGPVVVSLNFM